MLQRTAHAFGFVKTPSSQPIQDIDGVTPSIICLLFRCSKFSTSFPCFLLSSPHSKTAAVGSYPRASAPLTRPGATGTHIDVKDVEGNLGEKAVGTLRPAETKEDQGIPNVTDGVLDGRRWKEMEGVRVAGS